MTQPVLDWLLGLEKLGMKFGLENMRTLTDALDHPERTFRSLLIAGTNGKGSVTAMVETGLRAAGHRTARYTSPHLERLTERFVIGGREVDLSALEESARHVRAEVERLLDGGRLALPPTFFEVTTAIAFDLFRRARTEIAVLEVGLGGRLDATNVVEPIVTAITTIDFDHQAQLGNTIEAIAREKAGIIKPHVPVVIGRLPRPAEAVIEAVARDRHAPLIRAHDAVAWRGHIAPALPGAHQVDNAIVALALMQTLDKSGVAVDENSRQQGIEKVHWPGRLERLQFRGAEILVDAAHNPAGAATLASYIRDIGWTGAILVFAAMTDKDVEGMLRELLPAVGGIVCTTAPTPRAREAAALAAIASQIAPGMSVTAVSDPAEALARACALSPRVIVAGSMFLIGPLRGILR